ncbi:MAG: hypothetical protein KatS3mg027_2672 [Bacteroidia bacterium]|nr:MAG: hypothetical protein KatS3mg027_2672 [Bacteroidia bacterium]
MTQLTQNKNGVMSLPIPVNIAMSKNALKQSIYPLGKKHYESTDWLGNVRVTYTDKKSLEQWQVCFEREQFAGLLSVWECDGGEEKRFCKLSLRL